MDENHPPVQDSPVVSTSSPTMRNSQSLGYLEDDHQYPLVDPLNVSHPAVMDVQTTTIGQKRPPSPISRMKRKKPSQTNASLRCSCKKSRCLKLYCECFSAGQLCKKFCGCHECHNNTENGHSVSDARGHILSRNASAFSSKVVQSEISDGTYAMPTTSKHKRGCNCKKSQCLKNYCECHQVQVGCSLSCRCEGCLNTFGRKDECAMELEMEERGGRENHPYYGTNDCGVEIISPDQPIQHFYGTNDCGVEIISPDQPIQHFQCFGEDDDIPRFQYPCPSTEQPVAFASMGHFASPAVSWSNNELTGVREETSALSPHVSGCHNAAIDARFHESMSRARPRTETEALYLDLGPPISSHFDDFQFKVGTDLYPPWMQPNLQVDDPEMLANAFPPKQWFQKTSLDQKRVSPPHFGPSLSSRPPSDDDFIL